MAYRMQTSVPELTDLSEEPEHVLDMYGPDVNRPGHVRPQLPDGAAPGRARRAVHPAHARRLGPAQQSDDASFTTQCRDTDQPSAALVKDLKQRGLLDDTLVIWGGEFGRTPFIQGDFNDRPKWGRDHHPYASRSGWRAAGSSPASPTARPTSSATTWSKDPVHVHDFQATLLHLLGIDHEKLTFSFQGRYFRLTDVHGKVVEQIIA